MTNNKKFIIEDNALIQEWNWTKNNELGLDPETLTCGSGKKAWWKCSKGHQWQTTINNRNKGSDCPYCSGKYAIKGENDLATINPQLSKEWNHKKNADLMPEHFMANSHQKVWWKCSKGHEWQAAIYSRNVGIGCPYCSGRKAIKGETDLATINPKLASEWNYEKNADLKPENFTANSGERVWWKCKNNHEWQATIDDRSKGHGCPICSNQKVKKGYNDLITINPKLANEWNYLKNASLRPEYFTANSGKKVWWKCKNNHEWQATIASRNSGKSCPYCTGRNVEKGKNDLATLNPKLASEWNYVKNCDLKPEDVMVGSNQKVWWICSKGHEWKASIANRNKGRGCPICTSERSTSFPEYAIAYYLKKHNIKALQTYKEKGYELDIYIPTKKIAIEYDGYFYHKNKTKKDLEKNLNCKKDGIKLYRIREGLPTLNDYSIDYFVDKNQKNLGLVLEKVLSEITGFVIDVDLDRDTIEIENLREYTEKENSLLYTNPYLAKEWNYDKNGDLRPEHVLANSGKKVWWKCNNGHEWQAAIYSRNAGIGCSYCSGRKVIKGVNDLSTINPKLASEWNYEKNGDLKPEIFTAGSGVKVWWKCQEGHEWLATIFNRNKANGTNCPQCYKNKSNKTK